MQWSITSSTGQQGGGCRLSSRGLGGVHAITQSGLQGSGMVLRQTGAERCMCITMTIETKLFIPFARLGARS